MNNIKKNLVKFSLDKEDPLVFKKIINSALKEKLSNETKRLINKIEKNKKYVLGVSDE